MKKNIKIAISGKSGSGNTTVSQLVAEKLGYKLINFTFRNLAAEHNMTLEEVMKAAAADDSWDKEVDRRQLEMARESICCVLGSRLAIWLLPEADLKVYLEGKADTRAHRIVKREGGDFTAVKTFTKNRDKQDSERYLSLYTINNNEYQFADLIIDTDKYSAEETAALIIEAVEKKYSSL
ncbi:MAG: cytidylate kinase family protein [Spirochaetaceae bacterium]|jgi:cytidylate kinase|nr:cytidylate kinase family protein [Spirochaetaceae bacterium]